MTPCHARRSDSDRRFLSVLDRRSWLAVAGTAAGAVASGDQSAEPDKSSPLDPGLGEAVAQRWRFGMEVTTRAALRGLTSTFVVPANHREQSVELSSREVDVPLTATPRPQPDGQATQIVVTAPAVPGRSRLSALIEVDVRVRAQSPPDTTEGLQILRRTPRTMKRYLGSSPHIDTGNGRVRRFQRALIEDAADDEPAWTTVRRIYDAVRSKVKYVEGPIRNASDALISGEGDCEDLTSLFVAVCRISNVPARMVWIPGHCYPEFCLFDASERPHWYPCQAAGDDLFGEMPADKPILQKGDKFRVPEHRRPVRYLSEYMRADPVGRGEPKVTFVSRRLS